MAQRRKRAITEASSLPKDVLRRWAEFGVDELNTLAGQIESELADPRSLLYWNAIPTYDQLEATMGIPWSTLRFQKHDIRSARQLALFASRLRGAHTIRAYMDGVVQENGLAAQPHIDRAFNFLRGAEYTFPQILRAMNDIIDHIFGEGIVNYRVYAAQLQNLFMPGELRALDEYGVPIPILKRVAPFLISDDIDASRNLLEDINSAARKSLSPFEAKIVTIGLN